MNSIKFFSLSFVLSFITILDFPSSAWRSTNAQLQKNEHSNAKGIIFQSIDNGKTWQDISVGLPEKMDNYDFFAQDSDLYIHAENGIFRSKSNLLGTNWSKENAINGLGEVFVCKSGMYAINYGGKISKKNLVTNTWSPIYANFQEKNLRAIFETSGGGVLIGSDNGLFKSTNDGKTWKQVLKNGWVIKMVESNGVLLATNQNGIIRSTDDGESWNVVVSEGGVGIDVVSIKNGFAAITYNTESKTRRVRTSYDTGKTWQPIDVGLPPHDLIANILQVGDYFYCGHPKGIFKSADKGKNWVLVLPAIEEKVFNIYAIGGIVYAIPKVGGC